MVFVNAAPNFMSMRTVPCRDKLKWSASDWSGVRSNAYKAYPLAKSDRFISFPSSQLSLPVPLNKLVKAVTYCPLP